MLPVFQLSTFLKVKQIRTHDWVFILHSRFTVILLFAFIFFISAKQYFGDPITCVFDGSINRDYVENYCWTMGLYIFNYDFRLEDETLVTISGNGSYFYPGAGNYIAYGIGPKFAGNEKRFMRYYQWIVLFMFGQAMVFYFPSYLWKVFENGRISQLCDKITSCTLSTDVIKEHTIILTRYFNSNNKYTHWNYAARYLACTILNTILCFINLWAMDWFFTDFWWDYSSAVATFASNEWGYWNAITSKIFPKVAKCDINTYGASGTKQFIDALCLLPLNILNEKIFAFLYVWFILLTLLSIFNAVYHVATVFSKNFRYHLIYCHTLDSDQHYVSRVVKRMNYGDWFILNKLSSNINQELFGNVLDDLYKQQKGSNFKA